MVSDRLFNINYKKQIPNSNVYSHHFWNLFLEFGIYSCMFFSINKNNFSNINPNPAQNSA